jgi:hypothetical protein
MRRLLSVLILSITLLSNLPVSVSSAQNQPTVQAPSQNTSTHDTRDNVKCNDNGTYVNSQGQKVKRPENCSGAPSGATALCRDGSYSFSRNHRGTCSHHGGVSRWL